MDSADRDHSKEDSGKEGSNNDSSSQGRDCFRGSKWSVHPRKQSSREMEEDTESSLPAAVVQIESCRGPLVGWNVLPHSWTWAWLCDLGWPIIC